MRQHLLSAYKDGYKWVTFCANCSLEDESLKIEPVCVGKYISPLTDEKIKKMEERLDTLKSIF